MPTATANRTFATSASLPEDTREKVIALLNLRLADALDLKTQTKHAHWNVKGPEFHQLHELFDEIATHLEAHSDLIAERVTALGGVANGTARQAAAASSIPEYDLNAVKGLDHVRALSQRLGKLAAGAKEAIATTADWHDPATSDLFTEVLRDVEKDLWFLEAHLQV